MSRPVAARPGLVHFTIVSFAVSALVVAFAPGLASAQHAHAAAPAAPPVRLLTGLGSHSHPISTAVPQAQKFFDQGLNFVYGFNHEEAIRAFEQAAKLDPAAAMPYWGIAISLGENINQPIDPDRARRAYDALQQAKKRFATASDVEKAYIDALSTRYSATPASDPKPLAEAYAKAMKALVARYPDDLDAATLYAESLMDLKPWALYDLDGKPADGTLEVVAVLESVLARAPNHPGANHYYIHAVEASTSPDRALPSAARLEKLVPAAGHLVHMPSHIYARTGDYKAAADRNAVAAQVDRVYMKSSGSNGFYPAMYYTHNLMFLSSASSMAGRYADALAAAQLTAQHIAPMLKDMPMAQAPAMDPLLVQVRFGRWDAVLIAKAPLADYVVAGAFYHYARASAFAAKKDVAKAEAELKALSALQPKITKDHVVGLNPGTSVINVAAAAAQGRVALAKGDSAGAIDAFTKAVAIQDTLAYDEPPDFHYPVRESLGGALLRAGKAAQAETVFRADLARNRRNGRSLFGLWHSLTAQGKTTEANLVKRQYEAAWKDADTRLLSVDQL